MKLRNGFYHIEDTTSTEGETSYGIRLDAQHAIYRAHFPGNPITPGVCIIQLVAELLKQFTGRSLRLKRIVNVKFQHVLSPVEHATCRVVFRSIESEGRTWRIKAVVRDSEIQFAQLSMHFEEACSDESEER